MLQVLSLANHPRVWQKIAAPQGRISQVIKNHQEPQQQIEALFLSTLGRLPDPAELETCVQFRASAETPEQGLQGVLWSLINTREFLLQH